VPVGLIAAAISFAALTVTLAVARYPLGVEPQYDARAAQFQATVEQRATNDRLRWIVTPTLSRLDASLVSVSLRIEDRHSIPIVGATVDVECVPLANADLRHACSLRELAPGVYAGTFEIRAHGKHEYRVSVRTEHETYTDRFRRPLPVSDSVVSQGSRP
jgi:hypothetical protein